MEHETESRASSQSLRGAKPMRQALALIVGGLLLLGGVAALGLTPSISGRNAQATATVPAIAASPTAAPAVVREVLTGGLPPAAPGQTLNLVRFTIAPGAVLPIHTHPGMQAAYIESGVLTYHVLIGSAPVGRAGDPVTPGVATPSETVEAGQVTELHPGDWVVETPGTVHYGENLGPEPVVILAVTLFTTGEPASTVVNAEGTPAG
jgi:quercetin dioxygenase-like cupin family protein